MTAAHVAPAALSEAEARGLTDRIKRSVDATWQLLFQAHEGRAWAALKYPTWSAYVHSEFGIGRSRSYQLLDQAKVVREIAEAAGLSTPVDVSEAVTRDLKPHLTDVTDRVRDAVTDVPAADRPAVVDEVVRTVRDEVVADRRSGEVLSQQEWEAREDISQPGDAPSPTSTPTPAAADADDWTPSDALGSKPTPVTPTAPKAPPARPGVLEAFAASAADLRRATERLEGLSASPMFQGHASTVAIRHRRGLDDAVESLAITIERLPKATP